jgi:hypothetical protein
MRGKIWLAAAIIVACGVSGRARAGGNFFFSTGSPDGRMAMASRPSSAGKVEIDAADDFILTLRTNITNTFRTNITNATFVGLLPSGASLSDIVDVRVEISHRA